MITNQQHAMLSDMSNQKILTQVRKKFKTLKSDLDERGRRRWAASEAQVIGWGGVSIVSKATGISDKTIRKGIEEINCPTPLEATRQRRTGGGRKLKEKLQPNLASALDALIDPFTRGDPVSPLRWTVKSIRKITDVLNQQGFNVSHNTIRAMLHHQGYSLQANRKTNEGGNHPDRNKQFEFINNRIKLNQKKSNPTISVDTKKKEILGNKKNNGRVYCKKGSPIKVDVYDFIDDKLGKAIPYGVYDIKYNDAGVSVGITNDTAEFAVAAIDRWWKRIGKKRYSKAKRLLITADCGGSNGYRTRLWKLELQKFANRIDKIIEICHYPPGTSKWNKIEHRLFCHITKNWQGIPLETLEIVVQLIGNTKTKKGLEVHAWIDTGNYETGKKISDKELNECDIIRNNFHGDWNYKIMPNKIKFTK